MEYLLMPKKQPSYRQQRTHADFLTKLCDHLSEKESFVTGCKRELVKRFYIQEYTPAQAWELTFEKEHRKATQIVDLFS
jgi:lipoate-protein ligase A